MNVSAKIDTFNNDKKVKAEGSITLDGVFTVKNVRLIQGQNAMYAAMPSRQSGSGKFMDICYPVTAELRHQINDSMISAYRDALREVDSSSFDKQGNAAQG